MFMHIYENITVCVLHNSYLYGSKNYKCIADNLNISHCVFTLSTSKHQMQQLSKENGKGKF